MKSWIISLSGGLLLAGCSGYLHLEKSPINAVGNTIIQKRRLVTPTEFPHVSVELVLEQDKSSTVKPAKYPPQRTSGHRERLVAILPKRQNLNEAKKRRKKGEDFPSNDPPIPPCNGVMTSGTIQMV